MGIKVLFFDRTQLVRAGAFGLTVIVLLFLISGCNDGLFENVIPAGSPCPDDSLVIFKGKEYPTVQIGDQCWLAQNLDVGVMIDSTSQMQDNGILEKYCYRDDTTNCEIYGGLYQWDEIMQYCQNEGTRGICPEGWHIPINREIGNLLIYLNGSGIYLKKNDTLWEHNYPDDPENKSGFNGLPGGCFSNYSKAFIDLHQKATFWTSHSNSEDAATSFGILPWNFMPIRNVKKKYGYSVRCIKD
ncbi:MAG: hypothetical protein B6D64_14020 [Bacteroidetes bacterium 4484_276]|nr:MAG: hypothetical protein B6D64_14020 [Bacteroidetes bacterium 4484_276]